MGALMRSIDWSSTAVGPVASWPQSLRTALSILLETGFPMYIAWGPEFTQFYNDGYRPILGSTKHPAAMGISTRETFSEIWNIIGPMFEGVMQGRPTTVVDFLLPLDRHGFTEECYFIFSYSPIREERGHVGGVLVTVTETTQRVLGERRLETTQALAAETRDAKTVREACEIAGRVLARNAADLPFARIYLVAADAHEAVLTAACGDGPLVATLTGTLRLEDGPAARAMSTGRPEFLDGAGAPPGGAGPADAGPPGRIIALPIARQGAERPAGILVAGTSPRLMLDEAYMGFLTLVASQIGTAVAGAQALEEARARADALAELDRAKTAFFNNVSHEFRTPLTLMLGPTEEALASPERVLRGEDLETVHRNELRLLKLVNTLLDFSRIEAGRVTATFEPTDLSALTVDLASAFRSAMERAGLELVVSCPPLPAPVHVDREMWEKIVLNLLSNAFKFTFKGSIAVELDAEERQAVLRVRDTGVGIEPADLAHVFDRFHRVERAAARTHEGSGIGLALVRELVTIHGGTITAESVPGKGTVFSVRVPFGTAHLPAERIASITHSTHAARRDPATPYVEEALRWLPSAPAAGRGASPAPAAALDARVLVADDNADMRDYVSRILSPRFHVQAVSDGDAALDAARRERPDVIVSDIMMPGLDGFELVAALRADEDTRMVPIILLSARAGEEARIEGLHAGADDYLVKPFSARELVARVEAQLVRAKMRSLEEAQAMRLASVFEHAPVGVAILRGRDHVFEFANRQYLELVAGRNVVGKPIREALPELKGQGVYELLDHVFESGEPFVGHSLRTLILRGGNAPEETFFDFAYQPLADGRDGVTGIAVVAFDVTELTRARREAEAANRAKDEFLAMLGHELRNPLAPILTALQLMRLRSVAGAERERTIIERQVKHVVSLVDDLLDVSRITRGKVQLRRERLDLAEIVAKAIEMTSPAIEERRHMLRVDVPRGLPVNGDAARLAQVAANLLTNAAKYTDPGGTIVVAAEEDGPDVVLRVSDSGRGIDPDMLPRIFDLFSQERQEIARSEGGLGLGLAIVRSLVDAHGGSVEARSDGKGRGAEFIVRLPRAAEGVTAAALRDGSPVGGPSPRPGRRILVVDDNPDAAQLLADSLQALGHRTRVVFDGPSALDAAAEFAPDVALLDLGLPVMDGFEVAQRLRALPQLGGVQLVAITGYGQEIDRQRTREAGFDEHMVKPVDLDRLEAWLRQGLEQAQDEPPSAHGPVVA
jgi:signal transduction histidine kinase/CheY-like chemotaxis protein